MSENRRKLTPTKNKAIAALIDYPTRQEAADHIGINPRTLYRWLNEPAFLVGLRAAEGMAIDRTARRLISLADKAVSAIVSVMENPGLDGANVKRLAAQTILDQLTKMREIRNVEERLMNIEKEIIELRKVVNENQYKQTT